MNNTIAINLSRLAITGAISHTTPLVVIKEIADAHSIVYDEQNMNRQRYLVRLINSINSTNVSIVREPYEMEDLRLIARFVNSNPRNWKRVPLTEAFDFLIQYTHIKKLCEVHSDFEYGPQTPEHPYRLNASVLYGICNAQNIEL